MEIGYGYSSWLGSFSKKGALPPLSRSWWIKAVESGVKGVHGETPLHWALATGDAARAKAWLAAGGGFEPDFRANRPIHWLVSAGKSKVFAQILEADSLRAALEPEWGKKDRLGRDAVGLLVLARELVPIVQILKWRACESVSLSAGLQLALCDAMVAQGMRISATHVGESLKSLMEKHGVAAPSKEMPKQLSIGVWTQDLWTSSRENFMTPQMRAREEARELEKASVLPSDKITAPAKRI